MIYHKNEEVIVTLNQGPKVKTFRTTVKKLDNYTITVDLQITGKNLRFHRESGSSIPMSALSIPPDICCKACFSWELELGLVKFKRINRYERKRETRTGHVCNSCGYINTEN